MLKELPLTPHDAEINVISTYQPMLFTPEQGDGGYAIRVIEIYRLHNMFPLLDKFEELTGYAAPRLVCTPDEINMLVERGRKINQQEEVNVRTIENELNLVGRELGNAQRGISSLSSYNGSVRSLVASVQAKSELTQRRLADAQDKLAARRGLLGLLRSHVELMLSHSVKGFKNKIMEFLPLDSFSSNTYKDGWSSTGLKSHVYAWNELNKLELALKEIISRCTVPTDKYLIAHGGVELSKLKKKYYQPESEGMRNFMSADDFSKLMLSKESWANNKVKIAKQHL
ncbi:hypothetical protein ABF231_000796 [Yersinia ruckeri]|uniref:hypothetical protein n=1 Tax=Yersinia ruckeri TaxID=29486 RepID=UPI001F42553C|nr:hypothetical protein [Yersinia ruckeri]EKN4208234.1 hypothetical protein [Yersinia ruckeri]EKN4697554.1 hypothetical protein [Yersinia ruckeri]ELI6452980.1 hypothetical protein [Yersinia ruckeri]MCW6584572.1 hypothetical protein [Yersinia ruckeri]UIN08321.1 hypothetical protein LGL88_05015 [Yersinia ruckeri]